MLTAADQRSSMSKQMKPSLPAVSNKQKSEAEKVKHAEERHNKLMRMNKQLETENNVLTRKLHSIRNFKPQQGCIKLNLEKFREIALNPPPVVIYSAPIRLAGFLWKLCAERNVDNTLGLFLCIYVPEKCPQKWECRVNFTFCIKHNTNVDACIHRSNGKPIMFSNELGRCGRSGFSDIVGVHHLLDPQSGYLDCVHDCVKMGVCINVIYSTQA